LSLEPGVGERLPFSDILAAIGDSLHSR
jgi:hypothetical protein